MKTYFTDPTIELIRFDAKDVLTTSETYEYGDEDDVDTPFIPKP